MQLRELSECLSKDRHFGFWISSDKKDGFLTALEFYKLSI
ncbi:hypothetical protein LEP1GSC116_2287 [Leptospira interrogans serovar Icterohaemorrhagiae str. Verdun HP]|uniref:Uncharacterized protein n=1 Tax=Leptospira interrogans serovar Icterohaemorrhagiae str. Verdun HP TaxID=1049910 RepID=M6RAN0_LEPIR|nr:hypothetical protein LEP1GSC116_2287 [Leptospira interrogans serovar Icterohaemorrhagiae str. Verdun HP]